MTQTVLIYATKRQRKRLTRKGSTSWPNTMTTCWPGLPWKKWPRCKPAASRSRSTRGRRRRRPCGMSGSPHRRAGLQGRRRRVRARPALLPGRICRADQVRVAGGDRGAWRPRRNLCRPPATSSRSMSPRTTGSRRSGYVRSVGHYGVEMRVDAGLAETLDSDPLLARGLIRGAPEAVAASPGVERVPTIFTVRFFEPDDLVRRCRRSATWAARPAK